MPRSERGIFMPKSERLIPMSKIAILACQTQVPMTFRFHFTLHEIGEHLRHHLPCNYASRNCKQMWRQMTSFVVLESSCCAQAPNKHKEMTYKHTTTGHLQHKWYGHLQSHTHIHNKFFCIFYTKVTNVYGFTVHLSQTNNSKLHPYKPNEGTARASCLRKRKKSRHWNKSLGMQHI